MRILHIVDSLDRGGLEHVVCELATEQLHRGYDVSVYCLHTLGSLAATLQSRGVRVLCGHKRSGPDLRVLRELRQHMRGSKRALFHTHSMMPNYYACAARLFGGWSITVVNTRHDMGSTRPGDPREKLYRWSVPLTRLAVMVSQGVRSRFIAAAIVPARKARVVLNGIQTDCPQYADPRARAAARQLLHAERDHILAGCVGRLVELKNHALAIRILARLRPTHPQLRLVLIGGGPLATNLLALATELGVTDRLQLLGERTDARTLLPGLDIFLMPSLTEGHSIALLEAAAAGLPIIATDVGGTPEIVSHAHSGLLVPTADEAALAAAWCRLLDDAGLAPRLGANARAWAIQHVSVQAMADGYDRVYAEALG